MHIKLEFTYSCQSVWYRSFNLASFPLFLMLRSDTVDSVDTDDCSDSGNDSRDLEMSRFESKELHKGIGNKVVPRLREYRLMAPSGRGGEFTQPRDHFLAVPCISGTF